MALLGILSAGCFAPYPSRAQDFPPEIYVVVGRYWLAQSNLPYAHTAFASASGSEGKTLKALSSLAMLQRNTNTVGFLNTLHYDSPANVWQVQTVGYKTNALRPSPYRTQNGVGGSQAVSILKNVYLPALVQAEADLATFVEDELLVPLGRTETGYPDINLDRGDVLIIRSLLACGRFLIHAANSQNVNGLINDYILLEEEPGPVTIEKILSRFPDIAKLTTPSDLPTARAEAKNAITLYEQASQWIRTVRPFGTVRMFNLPGSFGVTLGSLYNASLADEAKFREKLNEYAALMDGPATISGFDDGAIDLFNGKPLLDGLIDLRSKTPAFRKNKVRQGAITDATFGGIYPTNTVARSEAFLWEETMEGPSDPYSFGLFIPPQVSVTTSTGNSISEGYQPSGDFLAIGYSWGYYNDDGISLFWINPQNADFSKLNLQPIPILGYVQRTWISGSSVYLHTQDWSLWPSVNYLYEISRDDGQILRVIHLNEKIPSGNIYRILDGLSDFLAITQGPPDWRYRIYKINKSSLSAEELNLGPHTFNYIIWESWALDETREFIWLAGENSALPGNNYLRFRISNGELLQTVPLAYPPSLQGAVAGKHGLLTLRQGAWPAMSLVSINYANGQEIILNSDLLAGKQYDWGPGFNLDASGEKVFTLSWDATLSRQILEIFSGSSGQLLQSFPIGQAGKDLYAAGVLSIPGEIAFATRIGDVSEPISVIFSNGGTANYGLDYLFPAVVSLVPGNTQQPIRFDLVHDNITEFDETVTLAASSSPESESVFQSVTLTILDDDGTGVGIFAIDNQGKEGRMNPDPFGFKFGVYDPIRFEVRRTGSTTNALAVKVSRNLLLSSAAPDDYQITGFDVDGQTVRIPAGQSSAQIVVSPKYDLDYPEGTESLALQVSADPAYGMTDSTFASASILDSSLYEWWSYQSGLLVANHPPGLDVDSDGMPNLLEMALGRDPNLPDSPNSIQEGRDSEGYLTLTFKRWSGGVSNADSSYSQYGVLYRPQATSSLEEPISWTGSALEIRSVVDTGDGMEQVTVRDTLSKTQPSRFLRVLITLQE